MRTKNDSLHWKQGFSVDVFHSRSKSLNWDLQDSPGAL
jgi:hypothetical protein